MKTLYTAQAEAKAGRDGSVRVLNGKLDARLTIPKEMGGPGGDGLNPEQLFAAGYAACFGSAVKFVAQKAKKNIEPPVVQAAVSIGTNDAGGFGLSVVLTVNVPGLSPDETEKLANEAHKICPYSNATRGNVPVTIDVA